MPIESFSTFVKESGPANEQQQLLSIRKMLIAMIASGAMDTLIKKDFLPMREEISNDELFSKRLKALLVDETKRTGTK